MTVRAWSTAGEGPALVAHLDLALGKALTSALVPDYSPLRNAIDAAFAPARALSTTGPLTQFAESLTADLRRIAESLKDIYRQMPRAARRALEHGRYRRKTRDRNRQGWPGTEAVCPDHPARVIYKRLLAESPEVSPAEAQLHMQLLERALERCGDADEKALHIDSPMTLATVAISAEGTEAFTAESTDRDEHRPGAPQFLVAVTASRNAPADGHAYARTLRRLKTAGPTDTT